VMKSVEEKYGDQVKVIFHDVWTPKGKEDAKQFEFDGIPTQIFLDENGKEYFRHVGFFAEDALVKVLKQQGVN
ncbi:MAG: thioredoxin, partial [Ignavibacteria bacterium]|nr:thioredoxin [Ignavibacteria bacterium]